MQTIKDLLNHPEGQRFLENNGITINQEAFAAQLQTPVNSALKDYLGPEIQKPVYAFQQIYVDVTQSMLDRMQVLNSLEFYNDIDPFFVWIDTDRAGSDKITTRMYWPHWGRKQSIPICPSAVKDIEARFVKLDQDQLEAAVEKLGMYLVQSVSGTRARTAANTRFARLKTLFAANCTDTLSQFNHRATYFLLDEYAQLNPMSVFVSELLESSVLTHEVEVLINQIDAVIQAFNQAIAELIEQDINPVVKPLAENYLPLNYSCLRCKRRLRLQREVTGGDQFAQATCRCGERYRFYLGNQVLSIDELSETGRWSPDVNLALLMNDLVSGFIGGQSSGVYFGLVMKAVLEKVLNKRRVPVLLPESLGAKASQQFDSLIYRYLTEPHSQSLLSEMSR